MEIAFLVIAVIGLLALTSGGSVSGRMSVTPLSMGPPQPWTPSLPPVYPPAMTPSTGANVNQQLFSGAATSATTTISKVGSLGSAAGPIGAAVGVGIAIVGALLAAHEARLKGAKNENEAVDQFVPVFDSFIAQVVQAYNTRQISAAQAGQAIAQFNRSMYNQFRSFVGAPGTAWSDSLGIVGQCNKSCTVGCCVYWADMAPAFYLIADVLGFPIFDQYASHYNPATDPRVHGRTITVPKIYPSKYSALTRESYNVTLN